MGNAQTFWKLTKHDEHSIPEGRWLEGQVEVRSQDGDNYWVSILITMQKLRFNNINASTNFK